MELVDDLAVDAGPEPHGGWVVQGASGRHWAARSIVLATGLQDEFPDIPGLRELWATSVVAHRHGHGQEIRGAPLAQLGPRGGLARTVERALLLSRWSPDVVLLTQGEQLDDEQLARVQDAGVAVKIRALVEVSATADRLTLHFSDGDALDRRAILVSPRQHPQTDLASTLGCRVQNGAHADVMEVDALGRTSVAGVWTAGTTAQSALLGIAAAGLPSTVAVALRSALLEEELAVPTKS